MRERLITALNSTELHEFFSSEALFPILLKGGYEDLFSMVLFSVGFENNKDLVPQYNISGNGQIDIAQLTQMEIKTMLEFGHQFSLQFGKKSSFNKLMSDVKKRTKNEALHGADLFAIQLITDVKVVSPEILETLWGNKFASRYGIKKGLNNPNKGMNKISESVKFLKESCLAKGVEPDTHHVVISVNSGGNEIDIHAVVSGPFGLEERKKLLGAGRKLQLKK